MIKVTQESLDLLYKTLELYPDNNNKIRILNDFFGFEWIVYDGFWIIARSAYAVYDIEYDEKAMYCRSIGIGGNHIRDCYGKKLSVDDINAWIKINKTLKAFI